ncbi:MAG: cation-transporting P-type ATPase [Actinomycetota bacterium]|nr:cation-transporting P-type ATPase [Actinomycetota bacterium]
MGAIGGQLADTMIVVLLVAAGLTAAVGDLPDMAVILAVVVINTALGAGQEVRSGRALTALADLTAPHATVVRDGTPRDVDAREVVCGDVLRLAAGDVVAADARLDYAESMQVDESMLTGESIPTVKLIGERVFAGTVVTRGRGDAVVDATAHDTAIGGIAKSLRDAERVLTPLQRQLATLGRRLAIAVAVAAAAVATISLASGRSVEISLVLAISLAVAAIPESLPAVVSLSLAMAARRMASRGVLTRRLAAVEALGSVTVLAADKTGTLTEGRMSLAELWPETNPPAARSLLEAAVLCNDACATVDGSPAARDDPTEVALVVAATDAGIDVAELRTSLPRIAEVPFDAATARMCTTQAGPDGRGLTLCKGSPEAVLHDIADAPGAQEAAARLAGLGRRVLAVAANQGAGWQLLGLVALADPPRAQAGPLVAAFRAAGVRPVMITGDHPATAWAVAKAVGIEPDDVYARVRPEQKTAIVAQLRSRGEVVAMTGDGVNDAPALRASDIGVAMGGTGTEVAKQAADLVLTGDDLPSMVLAIGEGRRAYDNLRRFLHYALAGGTAEVLIMIFGPLAGFALPLQAGQILWVNLLTHGLPGVAMGNEPAEADVLARPPRPRNQQLLDGATARRVGVLGAVIAAASLLAGWYAHEVDRPWQSTIFVALTLSQLIVALALRPRPTGEAGGQRNPLLLAAVALNIVLAVLAVSWLPLRELLRTEQLSPRDFVPCLIAAAVVGILAKWQARQVRRRIVEPVR